MAQVLIFTKILSQTDVEYRISIPTYSFQFFQIPEGENSNQFDVIDMVDVGRFWRFTCSIRRNGHPKPVLSTASWIQYVRDKGLRKGDQVSLFLVEIDGGLQFRIQARTKLFRLMGHDIWSTPV